MTNLISSALSGLNASQLGIATTEHNISNASTPGYSRQQTLPAARLGQQNGSGFIGQGVDVQGVTRIYDQYLSAQLLQEQSQATFLTTYYTALKQIDNLVADPTAGASPAMQSFFDAMSAVSNNPESVPARQTLLGNAQFAVDRFQAINQRMTDIANGLNGQITSSVNAINSYAQQISVLNGSIRRAIAAIPVQQPNDLLDQRDQLINQLNQEIKTTQVPQADGTVSVFVGNGQTLVLGDQAMKLQAITSPSDPNKLDIAYLRNGQTLTMQQSSIQGGNLGAYLTFRDQSLEPTRNALGRVALGLATSINQQNQLGQDLNGALGLNLFTAATPRVIPNANNNAASGVPTVTIANVSGLTTSDYQLTFNGGTSYTLLRLSDNTTTNYASLPQTVDGMTIAAPATVTAGDTFLIRPTANGARDIALATNDPAKIAAAVPMRATALTTNTGTGKISTGVIAAPGTNVMAGATGAIYDFSLAGQNATFTVDGVAVTVNQNVTVAGTGTGAGTLAAAIQAGLTAAGLTSYSASAAPAAGLQITHLGSTNAVAITNANATAIANGIANSAGTPAPTYTAATVTPAFTLTYTSATNTLTGFPAALPVTVTNNTVQPPTTIAYAAGASVTYTAGATVSFGGASFTLTGTPVNNDKFTVSPNTNATGDNRNILLMSAMQTQNLMANGTASFQGVYGQLVGDVGAKTSELSVTSLAQTNMAAQTVAAQQAVSGVNLDEEAANLMRYQKAYQAAAKAMQIANTLFDSVLAIGG